MTASRGSIAIRGIQAGDWQLAKKLRLRALGDAPDAFASELAEEQAIGDAEWQARARSNAEGVVTRGFFAMLDECPVGLVVGIRRGDQPGLVEVNAMWIAPEARRLGAARALLIAVEGWARERGATDLALKVTYTSQAAVALYAQFGFQRLPEGRLSCGQRQAPAFRMHKPIERSPT